MKIAQVKDFSEWREAARRFLHAGLSPDDVDWQGIDNAQAGLFGDEPAALAAAANPAARSHVPKIFVTLATRLSCHRAPERWALLYRALWRMTHGEPHLLQLMTDPLTHRLMLMNQEIGRDAHKTKAFVRFRCIVEDGEEHYVAWHRPDHRILRLVAPFFQRRFSAMRWSIFTPDESVRWDGAQLYYGEGIPEGIVNEDSTEELWLTYYKSTFNPARIKIKMMKREMPVRHWPTLPETVLIPQMLAEAVKRVDTMIATQEGFAQSAATFLPEARDYHSLREAARRCQGCPLHCEATQTVFGEGALDAPIMLVGEQPGDQEDVAGKPFVGPAGEVLDNILHSAGLPRPEIYITNAVKHFKFTYAKDRRMHRSPEAREVNACKPWLNAEIDLIKPRAIVTLGVTAGRALVHQGFSLKHDGETMHHVGEIPLLATWHPSAVLRAPDDTTKARIIEHIYQRLRQARAIAA